MNFCSNCGVKQNEESKFCSSCGESLAGIAKPIEPLEVETTSSDKNADLSVDLGMATEFKLANYKFLKLDNERLYLEYSDSLLGKITAAFSDDSDFKPVYYQDIKNVTCKHGGTFREGRIEIELSSGKKMKLGYLTLALGEIKERNEAADEIVKLLSLGVVGLLPEIKELSEIKELPEIVSNPFGGNSSSKGAIWYQTKWVWVWLILFWPIGLYGLSKRVKPEDKMKLWGGIAALFVIIIIFDGGKSNNSPSEADISPFTKMEVCKGVIASAAARPVNIMGASSSSGIVNVTYRRPDDKKRWRYRCKLEGNKGIWAMGDGRWRTHSMDSKITFKVVSGALHIRSVYSDGSSGKKIFGKSSF
jgi:hypothetical protein